ncbi:MAG TPA: hypothetical protein VLJ88_01655, partial [Propionibacteriaceae bacterium]|nr:hypothetical protein [Propionibacteriaceae bacterium]
DMHVEINANADRVKQAANKIRKAQEDEMPSVDDVIRALRPVLRAEIIDVLTTEPLVPNKPTAAQLAADPKATPTPFTVASALANIETDDDNDREADKLARASLEGKVDQLLKLLATPDTPAAG